MRRATFYSEKDITSLSIPKSLIEIGLKMTES